jgi:hypothetical protein
MPPVDGIAEAYRTLQPVMTRIVDCVSQNWDRFRTWAALIHAVCRLQLSGRDATGQPVTLQSRCFQMCCQGMSAHLDVMPLSCEVRKQPACCQLSVDHQLRVRLAAL